MSSVMYVLALATRALAVASAIALLSATRCCGLTVGGRTTTGEAGANQSWSWSGRIRAHDAHGRSRSVANDAPMAGSRAVHARVADDTPKSSSWDASKRQWLPRASNGTARANASSSAAGAKAPSSRLDTRRVPRASISKIRANASASGAGSSSSRFDGPMPRIYFLFLANTKVSNLEIWLRFFQTAPRGLFRALVHCKAPECKAQLMNVGTLELVSTVPSYYCTDLVSPMNQLISEALARDPVGHPMDKFAFVSDSTLPAKPFSQIYASLAGRVGSDFCVFPTTEWADVRGYGGAELAPKHHQWVTLTREHAALSLNSWKAGKFHDLMAHFRMNQAYYGWQNRAFDGRNFGCLDEFWHMMAVYGPLKQEAGRPLAGMHVGLPKFEGGALQVSPSAGWQGQCDTFVIWHQYLHAPIGVSQQPNPFKLLHDSLDAHSVPHGGNTQRPGWWDTISTSGIRSIRQSQFLFVRKFIDGPALAEGGDFASTYVSVVLS